MSWLLEIRDAKVQLYGFEFNRNLIPSIYQHRLEDEAQHQYNPKHETETAVVNSVNIHKFVIFAVR